MKHAHPQPATINIAALAPPAFSSLSSDLQAAILAVAEQLAIEAAEDYVKGLRQE